MRKNGIGWTIAIIFIIAFGLVWVAYSNLKEDYQIANSQNYYDFYASVTADIQLMEQILALEKVVATGNEDLQAMQTNIDEWGKGNPFVDVGMTETERTKFADYRSNSMIAISEFQRTKNDSEIEILAENLSAYKQQFNQWVEEVNECSQISGFCAGYGTESFQQ